MSRGTEQVRVRVMLGPVSLWSSGCNQTPVKQPRRADQRGERTGRDRRESRGANRRGRRETGPEPFTAHVGGWQGRGHAQ